MAAAAYAHNLALRFQQVVERGLRNVALRLHDGTVVTYAELDAASARAAHWLRRKGLGRARVAAIRREKSLVTFALWLGCIRLGAPYVMLDLLSPPARQERILATCRPALLLSEEPPEAATVEVCRELQCSVLVASDDEISRELAGLDASPLPESAEATGDDLAYLMFTSGSTGTPKGAAISQTGVGNFIDWCAATFGINATDVLTGVNPLYFDNSVFDLYASIFNGAALAPARRELVAEPAALIESLEKRAATLWFSVPSLLIYLMKTRALTSERVPAMRTFVFGGEGFPKPELLKLWQNFAQRARLVNVYGPTECTCICSAYEISAADVADLSKLAPLGKMAPNFSALVLGEDLTPVAPGIEGELLLLGPNVGKGYYNDPERSAAAFIQNPLNRSYREIGYRTGDLVRFESASGNYLFVGRKDNQIKHMGYRIELEEIEAALSSVASVVECAVVYARRDAGYGRIVAAVALSSPREEAALREALKVLLPPYMIPSDIHIMSVLPKNANGKVDRRRVAELYGSA